MTRHWLVLALSSLMLTGCDFDPLSWEDSDRYKEDFSYDYKLAAGGRLSLESFNGSIEIIGWERDAVAVTGTKYASRESVMKEIKIDAVSEPDSLRIKTVRPLERNCNCGARFSLKVPRKVLLDLIATSNASMRLESTSGDARLKTSNGSVKVWDVQGNLEATTSNASIELTKFQGEASLKTSNGRIKADGVRGGFEGVTSNSSLDITISELDAGKPVKLVTSNGSINLELESWKNNDIRASTSNSSINVRLPGPVNAELRASTSNGQITSDYDITTSKFSKTNISGKLGTGGSLIDLSTSNGNIRLLRR